MLVWRCLRGTQGLRGGGGGVRRYAARAGQAGGENENKEKTVAKRKMMKPLNGSSRKSTTEGKLAKADEAKKLQKNGSDREQESKGVARPIEAGKNRPVKSGRQVKKNTRVVRAEIDEAATVQEILERVEYEATSTTPAFEGLEYEDTPTTPTFGGLEYKATQATPTFDGLDYEATPTTPTFRSTSLNTYEEDISRGTTKPQTPHRPDNDTSPGKPIPISASLPLPPFLRPTPRLKDRPFTNLQYASVPRIDQTHSLKDSLEIAPFSTAFLQNPYAHALASPVRQCGFTNLRLPSSCLLDFHLTKSSPAPETKDSAKLAFAPLSLTAALIPPSKASRNRTSAESTVLRAAERAAMHPVGMLGSASYVTNQRAALLFTSAASTPPQGRPKDIANRRQALARQFVAGRRTLAVIGAEVPDGAVEWSADMADVVLHGLRRLVIKKLRFFLTAKTGARDKRGLVAEVPGGVRARLDHVEGVVALLRLKGGEAVDDDAACETRDDDEARFEDDGSGEAELLHASPEPLPSTTPFLDTATTATNPNPPPPPSNPSKSKANSTTLIHHTGPWSHTQPAHHQNLLPLPPPSTPTTLYFRTARYRNRRIALYNLYDLLGEGGVEELVVGTVFDTDALRGQSQEEEGLGGEEEEGGLSGEEEEGGLRGKEKEKECEWVTVQGHRATVGALGWCAKLAAYVARPKRKAGGGEM